VVSVVRHMRHAFSHEVQHRSQLVPRLTLFLLLYTVPQKSIPLRFLCSVLDVNVGLLCTGKIFDARASEPVTEWGRSHTRVVQRIANKCTTTSQANSCTLVLTHTKQLQSIHTTYRPNKRIWNTKIQLNKARCRIRTARNSNSNIRMMFQCYHL